MYLYNTQTSIAGENNDIYVDRIWNNLGFSGGGNVDGEEYSEQKCYEIALGINNRNDDLQVEDCWRERIL